MTLARRVAEANDATRDSLVPFSVAGVTLGHVRPEMARRLTGFDRVFRRSGASLRLVPALDHAQATVTARTEAVESVLLQLRDEGAIRGWRAERFALAEHFGAPPLLLLERSALSVLGARGHGVHLNGIVRGPDGERMWVAKRALSRATWPGLLDQLVAGGQPHGLSVKANLVKECAEEAGIDAGLAAAAAPVGTVEYCHEGPCGIAPGTLFVYDLELPADFSPRAVDGEVDGFECLPMGEVRARLEAAACFKTNSALVAIDCLVRRGHVDPGEPGYVDLVRALHRRDF